MLRVKLLCELSKGNNLFKLKKDEIITFKLSCVVKSLYYKLNLKFMALKSNIYLFLYYLFILSNRWQKGRFFNVHHLMFFFRLFRARVVPENILKKQARDAKTLAALKASRAAAKVTRKAARATAYANAEKYHNEYQATESALIKAKRDAKAAGSFFVEGEPKVAVIIRIRG